MSFSMDSDSSFQIILFCGKRTLRKTGIENRQPAVPFRCPFAIPSRRLLFVLIFTQGTRKYKYAFPCGRLFFSEQRRSYNTFWILYKQYNKPYDKTQRNNGKPEKKIVEHIDRDGGKKTGSDFNILKYCILARMCAPS